MDKGESELMNLALSLTKSVEELEQQINSQMATAGAQVKASTTMEARLVGTGFDIEQVTPERQAISKTDTTKWTWEVTPTDSGDQRLHLTLSAVVQLEGTETKSVIETFSRQISVNVSIPEMVMDFVYFTFNGFG